MNHWPFIIAAYMLALGGTGGMIAWAWTAMRRAERKSDTLRRDR
ncbi:hypothetical protein [Sphingomonas sanxanigenens]|uniref:Heme exporter protein D n=1 Tax=Sphingomonas sanxanigenens DSM 19645 = NX02 TaxID=1123269 RepID=W0AB72_9SPHN|nr:hypothetical protein [Sphingomonas sanxanigenens]AHE54351.1 hypothetical protein NX02_13265 [Sphingomonas sanxanigenens DSM 19645 = NX02]